MEKVIKKSELQIQCEAMEAERLAKGKLNMNPNKPKFFQAVLKPIKGNVLEFVYPHINSFGRVTMTMAERMGDEHATCPDCGKNVWWLQPLEGAAVREGGKPYIECMECGYQTHL